MQGLQGLQRLLLPGSLLLEYHLLIGMLFAECLLLPETVLLGYRLLAGIPFAGCLELPGILPLESLPVKSLSVARLPAEKLSQPEPLVAMRPMWPMPRSQMSMKFRRLGAALRRDLHSPGRGILLVFVDSGQSIPQTSMLFSWNTRTAQLSRIRRYLLPAEKFAQAEALTRFPALMSLWWLEVALLPGFGNLVCLSRDPVRIVVPVGDGQPAP